MVRVLCMLLVTICLAACGQGAVPEDFSSTPSRTVELSQESRPLEQGTAPDSGEKSSQDPGAAEESGEAVEWEEPGESKEVVESERATGSEKTVEPGKEKAALKITVGGYDLHGVLEDNPSAEEFRELLEEGPVTVTMEDYGGFEKVGPLGTTLTRSDKRITTEPGDVILYQGNQITIYYGVNTWNFTRLAKITDSTDLKAKLGQGTVQVTFSLDCEESQ